MNRRQFIKRGGLWLTGSAAGLPAIVKAVPANNTPQFPKGGSLTPQLRWWPFRENTGTSIADISGNSGTLTKSATGVWVNGFFGYGLRGDNTNVAASTAGTITYGSNKIAISAWMYFPTLPVTDGIYFESSANNNTNASTWAWYFDSASGKFRFQMHGITSNDTYLIGSITPFPTRGVWHHIVANLDGSTAPGTITAWLDNVSQTITVENNSRTGTANFAAATLFMLGRSGNTSPRDAWIDDVRIYNALLTAAQVDAIYRDAA